MEQIEALLKRINEENKKTKEVLDNITKNELNGNRRKNSDTSNESDSDLLGKYSPYAMKLEEISETESLSDRVTE